MPVTAPLIVLGQLVCTAFAAGLNLYLTVAVLGLGSRLGLIPALPPGLKGLENEILIGSAIGLYLIEFIIDKIPELDSVWDALHTVIRPLGAALLTTLAFGGSPLYLQIALSVLAGLVALAAHAAKAGLRIVLNTAPSKLRSAGMSTLEDLCAAGLALSAIAFPVIGGIAASVFALLLLLFGPRLWRAGALGVRALRARIRAFFDGHGWHDLGEVPPKLRQLVQRPPVGRAEPRLVRAAFRGLPGVGAYRNGWVVLTYDRAAFLYSSLLGSRLRPLPPIRQPVLHRGAWTDTVDFQVNGSRCTLFLLKDGPAVEVTVADLSSSP